jgi:hypothetical protein
MDPMKASMHINSVLAQIPDRPMLEQHKKNYIATTMDHIPNGRALMSVAKYDEMIQDDNITGQQFAAELMKVWRTNAPKKRSYTTSDADSPP